jgi:uncharacterized repeat protein (TIGR03837 family)
MNNEQHKKESLLSNHNTQHWDIFCKIVDNFGDIGICWRLAKQLKDAHGLNIRFFVDKFSVAKQMLLALDTEKDIQQYEGITIIHWHDHTFFDYAADVVLETFACGVPAAYLTNMHSETIWVNIDHLSAESWVSGFHAGHGKHYDTNFTHHFYFPGFNENTGGLLREQALVAQRDAFQLSDAQQLAFWQSLEISRDVTGVKISLFSYPNAPVEALLQSLANGQQQVSLFMPLNDCLPKRLLNKESFAVGDRLTEGNLTLYILPFLTQDNYDKLLWACDINFVRGEDSWVRAIWAGKPFVWQPYWQTENTHLIKLNAFLETFYDTHKLSITIAELHQAWSVGDFSTVTWQLYLSKRDEIHALTRQKSNELTQQETLTTKLVTFCANLAK